MVSGTLYATPNNIRTFEILIAAKYGNSSLKVEYAKEPLNSKKYPFEKLPYFESSDGKTVLTGSHAISKLVAQNALTAGHSSSTNKEADAAQIVQFFHLVDNDILPSVLQWVLPCVSAMQYNKSQVDEAKVQTLRLLTLLNDYLLSRTYLVGERLSLADVSVACSLMLVYQYVLDAENRKKLTNLTRWFETCVNQPHFKSVIGDFHACSTPSQFDQSKFKQFQDSCANAGASAGDAHAGSKQAAKPQQQQQQQKDAKPKEEKKKDKKDATAAPAGGKKDKKAPVENGPGPDEEMDASEEALAQEPKQNDPFAAFPKGTLNLEEFKRVYSNEDTLTKALPYFWQNFDPSAYSIWYCEYKYADELTLVFMSCNLIAGMFQRLDKLRKNAFGSMCLFGTDNNSTISGIWVWRSHELAFTLSDDWKVDYESYTWKKLDPNSEETKTMVKEYFAWEGAFGGKKFNQGKIFK